MIDGTFTIKALYPINRAMVAVELIRHRNGKAISRIELPLTYDTLNALRVNLDATFETAA